MIKYVREHGIQQFIKLYNRVKNIEGDSLLWGDEVEYAIFQLDETAGTVKLSLRGSEILKTLQDKEAHSKPLGQHCSWVPEWGSWMLEGTPARPYSGYAADLVQVERNMRIRRARILAALKPNEICPTVPCFPMMGVGDFAAPSHRLKPGLSDSLFIPDEIIHPAPRFAALVANIKRRRGSKVDIRVPRFKDVRTRKPQRPKGCPPPSTVEEADEMEEVYMDAMAFGMGCCCLQVTFQARDVPESRHLYDHLAVLGPMMLALTAATPIARGQLLDTDVRWDIIAQVRRVTACRAHHTLQFCRFATRAVANSAAGRGCAMGPMPAGGFPGSCVRPRLANRRSAGVVLLAGWAGPPGQEETSTSRLGCTVPLGGGGRAREDVGGKFVVDLDYRPFVVFSNPAFSRAHLDALPHPPLPAAPLSPSPSSSHAQSVDDRTPAERGAVQDGPSGHDQMAGHGVRRLGKSRYDSISSFICNHLAGKNDDTRTEKFNDIDAPVDEEAYKTLVQSGVDDVRAPPLAPAPHPAPCVHSGSRASR